jgi:hypothetical protein
VQVKPVDPRDTQWEIYQPRYRVYFWAQQAPGRMWSSEEWELADADVESALAWARADEAGRQFVLYAVGQDSTGPGLIRLLGDDPSRA